MSLCHFAFNKLLLLLILQFSVSTTAFPNDFEKLTFYTENYPPANFENDGKISGYAVEILIAAAQAVGQNINISQITVLPWPRSYRNTLNFDNSVLFSTTRTKHREELFHWVGPITDIKVVVLARKSDKITINSPLEMSHYKIGVIRDDIGEQSLLKLGIPRDSMLESTSVTVLAEQLFKGRIDLIAYAEKAAYWWAKQAKVNPNDFESVYILNQGELYYAFNKNIQDDVIAELQKGIDIIRTQKNENGETLLQEIINNYK